MRILGCVFINTVIKLERSGIVPSSQENKLEFTWTLQ